MGERTDQIAVQRMASRVLGKIVVGALTTLLVVAVLAMWSLHRDVQILKNAHHDDDALRQDVDALKRSALSGPEWMRERLKDQEQRLRALEQR